MTIRWTQDADEHGYTGKVVVWTDGNNREEREFTVEIRQGSPLGSVVLIFEPCNGGAWMSDSFEGAGISERDLQWATIWTAAALRHWKQCHKAL